MSDIHSMTWECPRCRKYYMHWDGRAKVLWCLGTDCGHSVTIPGANVRPFVEPTEEQVRQALYGGDNDPSDS